MKSRHLTTSILTFQFLILLIFSAGLQAQTPAAIDSSWKKILVVPYNPIMHLSDADMDISNYSEQKPDAVRAAFRIGALQGVTQKVYTIAEAKPLRPQVSKETDKDLDMIYGSLVYEMDTVYPVLHPSKADSLEKKKLFSKGRSKVKDMHELKYMNIRLSHPELLKHLSEKYGTDLFVFLNQFEIVTHYDDCLDLALKIYRRTLKLHYSVFDVTGKQLYGDVAVTDFPSNTNDLTVIMQKNFPTLSDYVYNSVPKRKLHP